MSYDIYIGNAEMDEDLDVIVRRIELPDAPTFPNDGMTGNGNSRHPGYSQWSNFCKRVGLRDLFFDKDDGLMASHPGTRPITAEHAATVREALNRHRNQWPDVTPGWSQPLWSPPASEKGTPEEYAAGEIARLIWLDWWMTWALANCERPAIHNH